MRLNPGTRLGSYEVLGTLGQGGMGEVYRARDTKLHRLVAIKILLPSIADDPDHLARFTREAQVLASLNHPNIAHIHGIEESAGVRALVMEFVDGPTLEDLLQASRREHPPTAAGRDSRGAAGLRMKDALHIAHQIAEALEAAHERGIVHRDLKPANVKVRDDGTVKVLDFGLAKAADTVAAGIDSDSANSPTLTTPAMTAPGMIMGTAAYMSPEQAAGKTVDKRSDLWAFGVVLLEMLTGRRTFEGETVSHVIAAVLKDEPDWSALPPDTPASIRKLLRRCLEKDRRRRLDSAAAARLEIDEALGTTLPEPPVASPVNSATLPIGRARALPWVFGIAGIAIVAFATWFLMRPAVTTAPLPTRFAIVPPAAQGLRTVGWASDIALSPDGNRLVYTSGTPPQLTVRDMDRLVAVPLPGLTFAFSPFFSPDGRWLGFVGGTDSGLKKVSMTGGPPSAICPIKGVLRGASWGTDDTIVFATDDPAVGLLSVSAGGGEPRVLTTPDQKSGEQDHVLPSILPGGRGVLFTILSAGGAANAQVAVLDLRTGQRKILIRGGSQATYVASGHLVYAGLGTLQAVRFDLDTLEVLGEPVTVTEQVMTFPSGAAEFSVSRTGTLAYVPGSADMQTGPARSLVWVTREGQEEPIGAPPRGYVHPRLSPEGKRIALTVVDREQDIWIWDLAGRKLSPLTAGPDQASFPVWTPDGKRIIYESARAGGGAGVFWRPSDGSGVEERLTSGPGEQYPNSISPDGKLLVFQQIGPRTGVDLMLLKMGEGGGTQPFLQTEFRENNGEISPDGHWLAYQSNESNQNEIYVRPFPVAGNTRFSISRGGGVKVMWARNGRELFYLSGTSIMAVPIETTPVFRAGTPTKLFSGQYFAAITGRTHDVAADGRFLMIKEPTLDASATPASMVVVLNWFQELQAKLRK